MKEIKLAKPIFKDTNTKMVTANGEVVWYVKEKDILTERKECQAALDKEKECADERLRLLNEANANWQKRINKLNRQLDEANKTMNAMGEQNMRLEAKLKEAEEKLKRAFQICDICQYDNEKRNIKKIINLEKIGEDKKEPRDAK